MPDTPPKVDEYSFGQITIDGRTYIRDVIILPDRVLAHWWRRESHVLHAEDLRAILGQRARPSVLVVGLGAYSHMRIARDTLEALDIAGIELIAESTEQAVASYNALRQQGDVAAAFHLTC